MTQFKSLWLFGLSLAFCIASTIALDGVSHRELPQEEAQPSPPLSFDVASIKPDAPPYPSGNGPWIVDHGRFQAHLAQTRGVIALAYSLRPVQVRGGPDWLDRQLYEFSAETENSDAGPAQIRVMLQKLLADRFKLAAHRETQVATVFTLVVGKNGSKMEEAKEGRKNFINWTGPGQFTCTECGLGGLVNILSTALGSPVVNKTGLQGFYNYSLKFTDPRTLRPQTFGPLVSDVDPDISTALQEQLGLKLEQQKGPVGLLLIDHIEMPSPN